MEDILKIRKYENLHIVFWLIKDTCWMMEWRVFGLILIVPAIFISLYISVKTIKDSEFFINLAITFWILANSYWMCCEFTDHVELKNYAAIPFIFGFIATGFFYFKKYKEAQFLNLEVYPLKLNFFVFLSKKQTRSNTHKQ